MALKAETKFFVVALLFTGITFSCDDAQRKSTTKTNEAMEKPLVGDSVSNYKSTDNQVEITDTLSKQKDSVVFQTSYDYETETYIYYHSIVGRYYDESTFDRYYPQRIQSLDSLIQLGNKKAAQ